MKFLKPTDSHSTFVLLIRHGATDANELRPYILQGHGIDQPLSAAGRRQAEAVARFLEAVPLAAVYASHLKRALETADRIASRHELTVTACTELREVNVGAWEGLDWETIARRHPEEYARFMENPGEQPYLGGESYRDVGARARPRIEELARNHRGETIAVVAHNVVNRALLAPWLGIEMRHAKDIPQINTGVNLLKVTDQQTKVVMLNSLTHLEEAEL
jgi:broad specificity phosphatase PhoE